MSEKKRANRLANESSPYLLQHAHNPVDWFAWGPEAHEAARTAQKPIFLSVGYSSCHWCHVMEQESFEDAETARLMNELFINIKVDREERPDVDEIYMHAVQLFSGGHGGWPMSVFLTPALEPFYAGTYFPPQDRSGLPSFRRILQATAQAWNEKRETVEQTCQQVVESLQQMTALQASDDVPGTELLDSAYNLLQSSYDPDAGGFGNAPKFPHPMDLSFLLRYAQRTDQQPAAQMALHTLHRMARGGMFDQLGGGFHRYATDGNWLIPHFEKMLYDNALLVRTYIEAWLFSRDDFHRQIASRILQYVSNEMTAPEGGFFSAQDADSEGVEGRFFVWTPGEIRAALPTDLARLVLTYYDVSESGNFEHGSSVLSVPRDDDVVASELGLSWNEFQQQLQTAQQKMLAYRAQRIAPATDDKIITSWNALMISAYARAYQVWRQPEWLQAAEKSGRFLLGQFSETLFRTYRDGVPQGRGYLDDHAAWIAACLDLYEATFDDEWLQEARRWNTVVLHDFRDDEGGGFFYSGRHHEKLIARSRSFLDSATPSGNAMQLSNLLRLGHLTGEPALLDAGQRCLQAHARVLQQYPTGMSEMLCGLDFQMGPVAEIVVAGTGTERAALLEEVFAAFLPNKVVAGWPERGSAAPLALLKDRQAVAAQAAVFVCQNQTCQAPVGTPEAVRQALEAVPGQSR